MRVSVLYVQDLTSGCNVACNALIGRDAKLLLHLQKDNKKTKQKNKCGFVNKTTFLEKTFMNKYLWIEIKDRYFSHKKGNRCSFFISSGLTTLPILLSNKCIKCPIFVFLLMLQTKCWMDLRQLGHMKTQTQNCVRKTDEKEQAHTKDPSILSAKRHRL